MIVIFPLNIPSRVILVVLALHIPPWIIDTLRKQCRRTLWGLEDKSDYLALFKSGGADYAHHISTCQIFWHSVGLGRLLCTPGNIHPYNPLLLMYKLSHIWLRFFFSYFPYYYLFGWTFLDMTRKFSILYHSQIESMKPFAIQWLLQLSAQV